LVFLEITERVLVKSLLKVLKNIAKAGRERVWFTILDTNSALVSTQVIQSPREGKMDIVILIAQSLMQVAKLSFAPFRNRIYQPASVSGKVGKLPLDT
jgi:hypothetical protein